MFDLHVSDSPKKSYKRHELMNHTKLFVLYVFYSLKRTGS